MERIKTIIRISLFVSFIILFSSYSFSATSENYQSLPISVNSGGGTISSENFHSTSSVGEPAIGNTSSSNYISKAGFISTLSGGASEDLEITTPSPLPMGTKNISYPVKNLVATGGVPDYTWIITDGTLPPGLTLSDAGIISGTPTQSQSEPFTFTVQVSDSQSPADTDTKEFSLTINPNIHDIVVIDIPDTSVSMGTATVEIPINLEDWNETEATVTGFQFTVTFDQTVLQATGATAGLLTTGWMIMPNTTVPGQITIVGADFTLVGFSSGTGSLCVMQFNVVGSAGDATNLTFMSSALSDADAQPVTHFTTNGIFDIQGTLTITTPSPLPMGTKDISYPVKNLVATGGVPDYTWIITDGTLPPGLTLSDAGIISGTPTQSQSEPFTFTVQVSDSQSPADTDTKEFSLTINPLNGNEHDITLNAGWNLITLPVNPSSQIMASTIIDKIDTAGAFSNGVLRWINGIWDPYDGSYPPADFPIEVGKGYFVHCDTSNITIPIEGIPVSSITIPILNGWTLIGVPCGSYQASTLIESLNDQSLTCDSVLRWINGVWDPYDGSYPPANFSIEVTKGYFVYSGNSGNWQALSYQISNQSDNSITISWVTDTAVEASIEYGDTVALGNTAYDVRGQAASSTTHYITITDLNPDTVYYFDLISGGERDDNNGNHYTFTTAVSINPSTPSTDKVSGTVYQSDGVLGAPGSIVLVTLSGIGNSQTCSYLASDYSGYEGTYQILFNSFRTLDLTDWFNYNAGDTVTIQVLGGVYGNGQATTNLVLPVTTQDVTLQTN